MQKKNKKVSSRTTWVGYFPRIVKDKTKYTRKKKHKKGKNDNEDF